MIHHEEAWRAPIVTEHLIIREAVAADSVTMQSTMDDEARHESGLEDQELRGLALAVDHGLLHKPTRMICEMPSGRIIGGVVTFACPDPEPPRLWLWLGPDGRGHGYEREALVAVVDHLHGFDTPEISMRVRSGSIIGLQIVESAGFRRVGETVQGDDGTTDVIDLVHSGSSATPEPT